MLLVLVIVGLRLEQPSVNDSTKDQLNAQTEIRRGAVLKYFLNRDLERMGLGDGQDYWAAFFIQKGVQDFPWIKGKILTQSGEVVGGLTFKYQYQSSSVSPSSVKIRIDIQPSSIDELLTSQSEFGLLVQKNTAYGKKSVATGNLLSTTEKTHFEVEYQVAEPKKDVTGTELRDYFEQLHPAVLKATTSLFKHRLRDVMMEARFELGLDEGFHLKRRYLIGCDDPDQHFLGSVRTEPGGRILFGVRPMIEDYTPELGLKFWQLQMSESADIALAEFPGVIWEGGFDLDPSTGELILEVQGE